MYGCALRSRMNSMGRIPLLPGSLAPGRDQVRMEGKHAGSRSVRTGVLPDRELCLGKPTEGPWERVEGSRAQARELEPEVKHLPSIGPGG